MSDVSVLVANSECDISQFANDECGFSHEITGGLRGRIGDIITIYGSNVPYYGLTLPFFCA